MIIKQGSDSEIKRKGAVLCAFIKDQKKLCIIIICAILGVLLLIMGNCDASNDNEQSAGEIPGEDTKYDMIEYSDHLEVKIEKICSKIKGVTKVSAVVTLENGFEYVYAQNIKSDIDSDSFCENQEYLVIRRGSSEEAVFAANENSEEIKYEIINLISATFGVKKSRIYVSN